MAQKQQNPSPVLIPGIARDQANKNANPPPPTQMRPPPPPPPPAKK